MSTQPLAIARNTSIDHSESTFVVSLDPTQGDFTSLQPAIDALPATGGKIFVKAGVYPLLNTISMKQSNIQIQGDVLRRSASSIQIQIGSRASVNRCGRAKKCIDDPPTASNVVNVASQGLAPRHIE